MAKAHAAPTDRLFKGERASGYDQRVRQVVPGYDALHDLAYLILNRRIGDAGRVLVAGCGSGSELVNLARHCPARTFTAFDPEPEMVAQAAARTAAAGLAERTHLLAGTIDAIAAAPVYDGATLMLVMHFIPDVAGPGGKAHLLAALAARLGPGAPLIFAEALADPAAPGFQADLDLWRRIMRLAGMDPEQEEKGFRKIVSRMPLIGEARLRHLLAEAGFAPPELFFRAHLIHGWVSQKR